MTSITYGAVVRRTQREKFVVKNQNLIRRLYDTSLINLANRRIFATLQPFKMQSKVRKLYRHIHYRFVPVLLLKLEQKLEIVFASIETHVLDSVNLDLFAVNSGCSYFTPQMVDSVLYRNI